MSLVKWVFVGLILLPAAEIVAFILVALAIGWLGAAGLFLATTILGAFVLKRSARRDFERLRGTISRDGLGAVALDSPGVGSLIGGILLVFPGFITDLLGALLLVPAIRRALRTMIARSRLSHRAQRRPGVVDLTPEEWRQVSEKAIDDARKHKRVR
ncbi:MAG: FxsA family protein [Xanthobacteraceae bacterium]